ncbi:MAG: hypothetical protein ACK5MI_03115 [Mangrovibacterium sp.]
MANSCINMLYCRTDNAESYQTILDFLNDNFSVDSISEDEDNLFLECDFSFRWTFPQKEMEQLSQTLKADQSLYIRCLSYKFGCDYVDYLIYKEGQWQSRIIND